MKTKKEKIILISYRILLFNSSIKNQPIVSQVYRDAQEKEYVKKAASIGIIIAVIIGIVIVAAGVSMNSSMDEKNPIEEKVLEDITLEESLPIEEETQEVESQGRNLSVELSETMNLKSP